MGMKVTCQAILVLLTFQMFAQTGMEHFEIHSKYINETRTVSVSLPQQYEYSSKSYPLVLILDHDLLFHTTNAIVNQLSNTSRMPESIVVSISAGDQHRNYFAPNLFNNHRDRAYNYGNHHEDFIDFLELELLPAIDSNYRTTNFKMVIGFSPSSAIALHALLHKSNVFQAYICLAAGNIIGDGYQKGEKLIQDLEAHYKKNQLSQHFLYVVSGSKDVEGQPYIATNIAEFHQKLHNYSSNTTHLKAETIEGEGHTDVVLPGLMHAFDFIFPKEKWSVDYLDLIEKEGSAKGNIMSFYEGLSQDYGFDIYPNADRLYSMSCLKNIGRRLLGAKNSEEAVEIFEYWVELYPLSHLAHYYLGISQKENDNMVKAMESFKKALELASKQEGVDLSDYRKALNNQ